jgi:hypothetical protein
MAKELLFLRHSTFGLRHFFSDIHVSISLPNDRKYFSTTSLFWTKGSAPARGFEIADETIPNRLTGPP